jgi:hypothetical protein
MLLALVNGLYFEDTEDVYICTATKRLRPPFFRRSPGFGGDGRQMLIVNGASRWIAALSGPNR